jgi:hypothetical protein
MEFESGGYHLRVEKLNAFEQLHLSLKIAPLLPPMAPLLAQYLGSGGNLAKLLEGNILQMAELAMPFTQALANLPDADAEQIMTIALSKVQVMTDPTKGVWVPLWIPAARRSMVDEFNDLGRLLPVVIKVIRHNLGNFMDALPTRREGGSSPVPSGDISPEKKTG